MVEGIIEKYQLGKFISPFEASHADKDENIIAELEREIEEKRMFLSQRTQNALGIEGFTVNQIKESLETLEQRLRKLKTKKELQNSDFTEIDPAFLGITHSQTCEIRVDFQTKKRGFFGSYKESRKHPVLELTVPRFAVYTLYSSECCLDFSTGFGMFSDDDKELEDFKVERIKNWHYKRLTYGLSSTISPGQEYCSRRAKFREFLSNAIKIISGNAPKEYIRIENGAEIYSRFAGLIPREIKEKLTDYRKTFREDIFLVADAEWQVEPRAIDDPLLIGFKDGHYFLLNSFNCTPMEEYAKAEFSNSGENERTTST